MSEITRFDFSFIYGVEEKPEGDFIYHWDYVDKVEELKQRINELEQQLKTARKEAFIAGCKHADQPVRGMWSLNDLYAYAEEYANNLEGK